MYASICFAIGLLGGMWVAQHDASSDCRLRGSTYLNGVQYTCAPTAVK